MNALAKLLVALAGTLLFTMTFAEDQREDDAEVLLTIERAWEANRKGDHDDFDAMLVDDFMGWSKESPAPRSKTATVRWLRLYDDIGRIMRYELHPLWIKVEGDVSVAHYLYTVAIKDKEGAIKISNGRFTDILVRTEEGWKFLAWHGGHDD